MDTRCVQFGGEYIAQFRFVITNLNLIAVLSGSCVESFLSGNVHNST